MFWWWYFKEIYLLNSAAEVRRREGGREERKLKDRVSYILAFKELHRCCPSRSTGIGSRTHWVSKSADAQVPYIVTAISAVHTVASAHVDKEGCLYIYTHVNYSWPLKQGSELQATTYMQIFFHEYILQDSWFVESGEGEQGIPLGAGYKLNDTTIFDCMEVGPPNLCNVQESTVH